VKRIATPLLTLALLCPGVPADAQQEPPGRMDTNNRTLDGFIKEMVSEYESEPGRWGFVLYDVEMLVLTDEPANRMRVIAPIADAGSLPPNLLRVLLEANFDRALDAKYAIWRDMVWATYVHPLGELTRHEFEDAVRQVANLHRNYGSSFSSTDVVYGSGGD
jgi:hypothetical protein